MSGRTGLVTLLVVGLALAVPAAAEDDPVMARAYEVHHRALADAAELIEPLLSEDGKLSIQPRLKTLAVVDRVSVLDQVGALIESFDLPPRNVEMTLTLILGSDESGSESGRLEVPDVTEAVVDVVEKMRQVIKWKHFELLGSRSLTAIEGGRVTATLSDEYRVVFRIDAVQEGARKVKFKDFSVQKIVRTADGGERYQDVYTADIVSPLGRLHMVGAASGPDSSRAMFLTLQTELR